MPPPAAAHAQTKLTEAQIKARLDAQLPLINRFCAVPSSAGCQALIKLGASTCISQVEVCARLVPQMCNQSADWKKRCTTLAPMFCNAQKGTSSYSYCLKVAAPYMKKTTGK